MDRAAVAEGIWRPGWSIIQRYLWEQESSLAGALPPLAFSITMVGPVIYTFGNAAQKQKFLPRILSGDDWWCQGYSEPGSARPRDSPLQGSA